MDSPPIYPITYRASLSSRISMGFFGLVLIFFAGQMIKLGIQIHQLSVNWLNVFILAIAAIFVWLAVLMIAPAFFTQVKLYRDRIAVTGLFKNRELAFKDIQGFQKRLYKGNTYIDILSSDENTKKLTLSPTFNFDSHFDAWLATLNNMDAAAEKAIEDEIASDPQYGFTPEDRQARAAKVKKLNMWINFGTLPYILWLGFYPKPAWLAIGSLVLIPWIAIMLVAFSNGFFTILGQGPAATRMKCNLLQLILTPVLVFYLMVRLSFDNGLPAMPDDWMRLLMPGIVIAIFMTALVAFVSREQHEKFPYGYLLLAFAVLIVDNSGSIGLLNGLFDRHNPNTYELTVVNMHHTSGKYSSYWLETVSRPDEHYTGSSSLRVPSSLYYHVNVNQDVCVQMHPGAFGMPWESMGLCHA